MEAVKLYKVKDLKDYVARQAKSNNLGGIIDMTQDMKNKDYKYFDKVLDNHGDLLIKLVADDLKETHINLMKYVLKDPTLQQRWNPDFFPFTEPSYELEIFLKNRWLEVLGSGVVHKDVLKNSGINPDEYIGWASGIGIERLAMILFDIHDIRLFWSQDDRFMK